MKDPERTFFQEISLLNLAEEGVPGGGGGGGGETVSHIKRRVQEAHPRMSHRIHPKN
jgi:hypothetical protein